MSKREGETDEEWHSRMNAEIFRRRAMTSQERKDEDLNKLYPARVDDRMGERRLRDTMPCRRKACRATSRTPCRLLQYLEECVKCGERYGENHN